MPVGAIGSVGVFGHFRANKADREDAAEKQAHAAAKSKAGSAITISPPASRAKASASAAPAAVKQPEVPVEAASANAAPSEEPVTADPAPAGDVPVPPTETSTDEGGTRGVIRLLMAGHFKGVADVRLRINFHEQLQGLQAAGSQAAAGDQAVSVKSAVSEQLTAMIEAGGFTEEQVAQVGELQKTFEAAVDAAIQGYTEAETPSMEELTASIWEAFATLMTSLETLIAPAAPPAELPPEIAPEELIETVPPPETTVETATAAAEETTDAPQAPEGEAPVGDAALPGAPPTPSSLDALQQAFEGAMAEFEKAVAPESFLPELSGPTGNGAAYEKFLAIYQGLYGLTEAEGDAPAESVDVTV